MVPVKLTASCDGLCWSPLMSPRRLAHMFRPTPPEIAPFFAVPNTSGWKLANLWKSVRFTLPRDGGLLLSF